MKSHLMVVSNCYERLSSWIPELDEYSISTLQTNDVALIKVSARRDKPSLLVLDLDVINKVDSGWIWELSAITRIVVIGGEIAEGTEWELLKAGVRGCCKYEGNSKLLRQMIEAVLQGELWIRRTLTCRLIDELGKASSRNMMHRANSSERLNKLTQRELDIAVRVGKGENNKQIANACGITERTVKAHLTEVFQKLGVSDRLNLALVLSSEEKNLELQDMARDSAALRHFAPPSGLAEVGALLI